MKAGDQPHCDQLEGMNDYHSGLEDSRPAFDSEADVACFEQAEILTPQQLILA